MDAKKYIPYAVNFKPAAESKSGLLEISGNQINNDATKFLINQNNGSVTFQVASTTQQSLLLQVHLGEGSLVKGSWNTILNVPAATYDQRVSVSEAVTVPIPPQGTNTFIRVLGSLGYAARSEDFVAVNVYPMPGAENVA